MRFFIQITAKRHTKKQTQIPKQTKQHLLVYAVFRSWVASQDVELQGHTLGLTNVRRSLPEEERQYISESTFLTSKDTRTADRFINIREELGSTLGAFQGVPKIIATQTRQRLWTEVQTTRCGQKMVQEQQLGNGQTIVPNSRNIPGKRSCILQAKNGMRSSIYLDRQPRRNRIYY